MRIDFHVHSSYSGDAITKPETLLKIAEKHGFNFAITDHDNCGAWPVLKKLQKNFAVQVVYGEEIKTTHNGNPAGELTGLFLQEEIHSTEYMDVIDEIKSQDALLCVPHPFDHLRPNFKYLDKILKKVDVIEVFNAHCWKEKFNTMAKKFAEEHQLVGIAGSDSHTPEEFGNAYTEIKAYNLDEVKKKLLKGEDIQVFGRMCRLSDHAKTFFARGNLIKKR